MTTAVSKYNYNGAIDSMADGTRKAVDYINKTFNNDGKGLMVHMWQNAKLLGSGALQFIKPYTGMISSDAFIAATTRPAGTALTVLGKIPLPSAMKFTLIAGAAALGTYMTCFGASQTFTAYRVLKHQHSEEHHHGIIWDATSGALGIGSGLAALSAIILPAIGKTPALAATIHRLVPLITLSAVTSVGMKTFGQIASGTHWLIEKSFLGMFSPLLDKDNNWFSPFHPFYHAATHDVDAYCLERFGIERAPTTIEESERKSEEYLRKKIIA